MRLPGLRNMWSKSAKRELRTVMISLAAVCAVMIQAGAAEGPQAKPPQPKLPPPDVKDVRYGPCERNFLDIWKAKTAKPSPLLVYIHGGGFYAGDK